MMLSPELTFLLGVVVFWFALYVLSRVVRLDRHGLEVKPFYFMYRSKALNKTLDNWAKKRRKLWLVLSNISIAFGVGLLVFSIYSLLNNLLRFIFPIGAASPIVPVIPVLTIRLYWLPYFFFAVGIVILTHELAHGIIARLENIPVLSTGILAFLVFFGAFVEPDEKKFEKASVLARLRMLSAGSSINLVTALFVFLLMSGLFAPPAGLLISEVVPNGPVDEIGLQQWDVIMAINGTQISSYSDFLNYMEDVKPNQTLTLTVMHANVVEDRTITTMASDNSSRGAVGVPSGSLYNYQPNRLGLDQYTGVNLFWTLFWIYLLGLSLAVINMLPAYPLDGERLLYYPLKTLIKKRKRELRGVLSAFSWGLLFANIVLTFWMWGLLSI
ncbi:MAG: site-2 protease family protein [Candidatus Bathyarchaeia archaeon]